MRRQLFNKKFIVSILLIFSFVTIGFAYLSTTIQVKSNITVHGDKFDIEFDPQGGSMGSISTALSIILYGHKGNLPTPTKEGNDFEGWYTEPNGKGSWYPTYESVDKSMTLYANWTLKTYILATKAGKNGTIDSESEITFSKTKDILVTPDEGYYVESFSCDNGYTVSGGLTGENAIDAQTFTVSNNNKDSSTTCEAVFALRNFELTTETGNNGSIDGDTIIEYGATKDITVTPNPGYFITSFSCNNGYTVTGGTTGSSAVDAQTFTVCNNNTTSACVCTADFAPRTFDLTTKVNGNGTIDSSTTIVFGTTKDIVVTPNPNYYIESFTCDNGYTVSGGATGASALTAQTFTVSNNNKASSSTCTATFAIKSFKLTTVANANGNIDSSTTITYGGTKNIKVTPDAGYYISSFTCDNGYTVSGGTTGTSAVTAQTFTISNNSKSSDTTCTASFAVKNFSITTKANANGTVGASTTVTYGGTKSIMVTPNTGYYISSFTCDNGYTVSGGTTGTSAITAQSFTVSNNSKIADTTCTASFAARTFNITTKANANGSIGASTTIAYGGTKSITVTPNSGYYISSFTCDNGYAVSGGATGTSANSAKTFTVSNNNKVASSTCTASFDHTHNYLIIGYTNAVCSTNWQTNEHVQSCTFNHEGDSKSTTITVYNSSLTSSYTASYNYYKYCYWNDASGCGTGAVGKNTSAAPRNGTLSKKCSICGATITTSGLN